MKKTILRKYAQLIARVGGNVQKGQEVFIYAGLDQPEFIAMLVEECYKLKAKKVEVIWNYPPLTKLDYRYQNVKTLGTMEEYQVARWKHYVDVTPCRIYIDSDDPDGLKGINQEKMQKAMQKRYPIIKPYRDALESHEQWCIAAVPGQAWARKVFPGMRTSTAVEKLWEAIIATARVTDDPAAAWDEHNKSMRRHCDYLNSLAIESLHYTAGNGTDFTVGFFPEARFNGGCDTTKEGVVFNPNMPTEECFISPKRGVAEGIVYGSKPLCYNGQLVEDFWIRFHEGKAVEWDAAKNKELLTTIITMDEGSAYLGECALVPYDSPICQSGILFYNTLFDENAACHLALGMGFADCVEGYMDRTLDECHALGVNDSMVHEDFMIGTADMAIDAVTRDGRTVAIFRDGNWAF